MKNLVLIVLLFSGTELLAQSEEIRIKHYNVKKNLGIDGYDPVSYFQGDQPKEGEKDISTSHKGITYYFSTTANRDAFKANPEKYEPQYGGWCAYALGETGEKVKVDPETFKIIDGKLYLFYNFWGTNTLNSWNKNEPILKSQGDKNWAKIIN